MTESENEASQLSLFLLLWGELGRWLQGERIYLGSFSQNTQAAVPWTCIWAEHHGGNNRWQRTSFHSMHDQETQRREAVSNSMSPTICFSGLLPTTSHVLECLQCPEEAPAAGKQKVKTQSVGSVPHWNPITSWWCLFSLHLLWSSLPLLFHLIMCAVMWYLSPVFPWKKGSICSLSVLHFVISSLSCTHKCFLSPSVCFLRLGGSNLHLLCNAVQGNSILLFWTSCPSHLVSNLRQHPKQPCNSSPGKNQRRLQGSNYKQSKSELYN